MAPIAEVAASTLAQVDDTFAAFQAKNASPGMSYGIVIDGRLVHAASTGASTIDGSAMHPRSVLRVASMTKSFTAATILFLRDEGRLRLDDPVGRYVPELDGMRLPTADSPVPTLRMLLTMSAGLPTDDPWADREESMEPDGLSRLLASGLSFSAAPGTDFQYSNLGYVIAGRVIANVTGERYHDVVRRRLIEPLGLTSTGFAVADVPAEDVVSGHVRVDDTWSVEPFTAAGEFSPLGGIFSSVADLALWVGGFTDAFPPRDGPDDGHPLCRASRREMQQLQRFSEVTVPPARDSTPALRARVMGYGLGLVVTHDTRWGQIVGHSGGYPGYGSHMRWHPTSGVGVIALGNGRYVSASEPAAAALEIVLASLDAPSRRFDRWARTRELQRSVQSLVQHWDDTTADRIFASNVDADVSRDRRRTAVQDVAGRLGVIAAGQDPAPHSDSAAHIAWWITGEHGRARVQIQLTPHADPLVQTLDVSFVGAVSAALANAAQATATELAGEGAMVHVGVEVECVEWRSRDDATFRIRAGVDQWTAVIVADPESGEVTSRRITASPPTSRRFEIVGDPDSGSVPA